MTKISSLCRSKSDGYYFCLSSSWWPTSLWVWWSLIVKSCLSDLTRWETYLEDVYLWRGVVLAYSGPLQGSQSKGGSQGQYHLPLALARDLDC